MRSVTVVSLDTLLMDEDAVNLVHLDCQGQELPVLEQALKDRGAGQGLTSRRA